MATPACPGCGAAVSQDDLICFTCGTNLPRRGPVEEESAPPTVMQEYLRPDGSAAPGAPGQAPATGPISPIVLRLSFPAGNVDVPAGTSLVLGRDPGESLVAAAFAGYENVSRRHATITVSDTGQATIRDEYSTNGTFVNDDRVLPGTDVRITDGDRVRLAADVAAEVSLPSRQGFNSNGHPRTA
jgi:pSer/pThr/pTyr-binding forkhead associated (FHA) protein